MIQVLMWLALKLSNKSWSILSHTSAQVFKNRKVISVKSVFRSESIIQAKLIMLITQEDGSRYIQSVKKTALYSFA